MGNIFNAYYLVRNDQELKELEGKISLLEKHTTSVENKSFGIKVYPLPDKIIKIFPTGGSMPKLTHFSKSSDLDQNPPEKMTFVPDFGNEKEGYTLGIGDTSYVIHFNSEDKYPLKPKP